MGQTAQSLTCSIVEKPHTGLDHRPRIPLPRFRARTSDDHHSLLPYFLRSVVQIQIPLTTTKDSLRLRVTDGDGQREQGLHGVCRMNSQQNSLDATQMETSLSIQSSVKTFLPGFGDGWLKYRAIVQFWGYQLNICSVILEI